MPKCKYCNEQISRLDKEFCPFCGGRKPLEDNENITQDFTKSFEAIPAELDIKEHSKKVTFFLSIFLGLFGAAHFYLGYIKKALIDIGITLVIFAVATIIFLFGWKHFLVFIFAYLLVELYQVIVGLNYLIRHDLTDSNGEFLR